MTPKDFLTVLENSIAQDKAEEVVNPVSKLGAKVFFRRLPVENLSGMDNHIMKLQRGLKNLDTESCSDSARFGEAITTLFDLTKGTYFTKIHNEVTESIRVILPPEMRDTVNNDTTFSLTSSIFEDMLKQMNSAVMKMSNQDGPGQLSLLPGTKIGINLLVTTMKKLQDFWQICRVCCWLRTSPSSSIDIHDELEAPRTVKVVEAIFQSLLNNSPEETSKGAMDGGLDASLRNFLQAVADKIRTQISPDINIVDKQPYAQESDLDTEDSQPVADCSAVTGTSETVMNSEVHQTSFERMEPPAVNSALDSRMLAAASEVVSALVSELKSTIKEDLALVDPSVDPLHYTTQVQVVSDKVLKSIQATMQEVLLADIFSKANGAMTPTDDAQLRWELVTGSKHILRSIIDCIMLILHSGDENIKALNKQSLQNVRKCLIMYKLHLRDFCVFSDVSIWEIQPCRCRGFTVRVPTTSQRQDLPAEEPSNSQAASISTAIHLPGRKSFFSRVSAAFTKIFRK